MGNHRLDRGQLVDPVILDLTGTGLPLTTLDQGVNFAMLPQADAIPTAWLRAEANQGEQRTAAFLVLNDESNDASSGDVQISSITELLSEFFQGGRTSAHLRLRQCCSSEPEQQW